MLKATPIQKYQHSQLSDAAVADYKAQLLAIMEQEQPYLDPSLTLNQLAELLGVSSHALSRIINEGFGKHFHDFVNDYRIAYFLQQATDPEKKQFTLFALALDSGFNTKATFNKAFKKVKGTTPSAYLKAQKAEDWGTNN